jgi:dTDP-4-dehydrorhamnose reductase
MLAHDVLSQAPEEVELVPRTSRELDITNQSAVDSTIAAVRPDVVINCAAYTDVDGAESHQDKAFAVNGEAPGVVAAALERHRRRTPGVDPLLVHFSTDYVFDGTGSRPYRESDPVAPAGVYAASKLAGERKIAEHGRRYLILRTQWLYGIRGKSFPRTMWERATAGLATKVVTDQTGRPTYTVDLAQATWQLLSVDRRRQEGEASSEMNAGPILHVTNAGSATWYQVAEHVFRRAGNPELLTPCTTADFPRPAKRPPWSVLDTTQFEGIVGRPLPVWTDALDRFLNELEAAVVPA